MLYQKRRYMYMYGSNAISTACTFRVLLGFPSRGGGGNATIAELREGAKTMVYFSICEE